MAKAAVVHAPVKAPISEVVLRLTPQEAVELTRRLYSWSGVMKDNQNESPSLTGDLATRGMALNAIHSSLYEVLNNEFRTLLKAGQ